MKRRVFLLVVLAAVLCACSSALAISLTWNQTCLYKTSSSTTLYVLIDGEDQLRESSTLPAGTYIRKTGQSMDGKTGISYSLNNSDPLHGYIDGSAITYVGHTITLPSGAKATVGEALLRSRQALNLWLEMEYGETLDGTYTDENGEEHEIGDEDPGDVEAAGGGAGDAKYWKALNWAYANNGADTPTVYRDEAGNETEVNVVYLGVLRSMIELEGEKQLVETWHLSWETDAPEEKALAVLKSPQHSREIACRADKSDKSTILAHVSVGKVVQVIRVGKDWALVDVHEAGVPRVYVPASCLDYWSNMPRHYETAKVTINGKTKSKEPIGVRCGDGSQYQKVESVYPGDILTVYAQNKKWAEVDVGGYHVFILKEFMTMDEVTATADAR